MSDSRKITAVTRKSASLVLAGAVAAAGAGLVLWIRRRRPVGEESLAEEVEAHPS